jgi:hypothetical protein
MTNFFNNICEKEKKQLKDFNYSLIDNLNEKTIKELINNENLNFIINVIPSFVTTDNDEMREISENITLRYKLKSLLLSKKLDEKITFLNNINEILKAIEFKNYNDNYSKIAIKKMTFEQFCANCQKYDILRILLNDQSVHEEIIKRLPEIIFIMYKYNFGYSNKDDKNKIISEKNMIFNILFNKLSESEQNNENLVKSIKKMICDFSAILSEEDKLYVYEEIQKYLEKSIKKKGIPVKEHLLFIIDYSLKAIKIKNNDELKINEKDKNNINDNEKKINEIEKDDIKNDNGLFFNINDNLIRKYFEPRFNEIMNTKLKIDFLNKIMDYILKYNIKEDNDFCDINSTINELIIVNE